MLLVDNLFMTATMRSSTFSEPIGPVLRGVVGAEGRCADDSSNCVVNHYSYIFRAVLEIIIKLGVAIAHMEKMVGYFVVVGDRLDMPACNETSLIQHLELSIHLDVHAFSRVDVSVEEDILTCIRSHAAAPLAASCPS